jgi:hypothetical protein
MKMVVFIEIFGRAGDFVTLDGSLEKQNVTQSLHKIQASPDEPHQVSKPTAHRGYGREIRRSTAAKNFC